jgi:hypothetical protein
MGVSSHICRIPALRLWPIEGLSPQAITTWEVCHDKKIYSYSGCPVSRHRCNASLELAFEAQDMPTSLYADFVQNQDADDLKNGCIAGVSLRKAKEKGSWQFQY